MNGCYNTMGIDRVRGSAGVAACVLAVAAAFAPGLAAQGAKEANGRGRPSATLAGPSSPLQPPPGLPPGLRADAPPSFPFPPTPFAPGGAAPPPPPIPPPPMVAHDHSPWMAQPRRGRPVFPRR